MRALQRRVPAAIGAWIGGEETETPVLLVDAAAVEHNCKQLNTMLSPHAGITARPHVKSHKCPSLAIKQLELSSVCARGICAQKLVEVEAMAAAGIKDILLSNQLVSMPKLRRFAAVAASGTRISIAVDHPLQADRLSAAMEEVASGSVCRVLIEVDCGQKRCGVADAAAAVTLAKHVASLPHLELSGVQCYHGAAQHIRPVADREEAISRVADIARACVEAFTAASLPCGVVTGGGSGTFPMEAASGVFTEVQPGSYVVWDRDYSDNLDEAGERSAANTFQHALQVMATVISRSTVSPRPRVVLDCGLKAMCGESGLPVLLGHLACSEASMGAKRATGAMLPPLKIFWILSSPIACFRLLRSYTRLSHKAV
jgi:D-serine deaminase-like pyridoxal phosphate-dependent protein